MLLSVQGPRDESDPVAEYVFRTIAEYVFRTKALIHVLRLAVYPPSFSVGEAEGRLSPGAGISVLDFLAARTVNQ